ncbi:MAG: negative regulator of sigma-Y activity [Candidatus Hodarchaeales archaeon]|jgi:hypothetical protein
MQEISSELIIIILTLAIVQISLQLYAVYDWYKQGDSLDSRYIWLVVIFFGNAMGVIIFFLAAPRETQDNYLDEEENKG